MHWSVFRGSLVKPFNPKSTNNSPNAILPIMKCNEIWLRESPLSLRVTKIIYKNKIKLENQVVLY